MSIEAYNAFWKWSGQKKSGEGPESGARLVLLAIADYTNSEGIAWPAVSTLAEKVGMSKRQVQRWLRALEKADVLEVRRNQGRRGSNIYRILLNEPNNCDAHVIGDGGVANVVSSTTSTRVVSVTQSVNEPKKESTPIVPKGDDVEFWIQLCFDCFKQPRRPLPLYVLRRLMRVIPSLNRKNADSLRRFYRCEEVNSKQPPYNSRKHSPERLMLDLPRQLAFAVQECPPPAPPKEYPFTLEDACQYLRQKYGHCRLRRSLAELDTSDWDDDIRKEIYEAMRTKKEKTGA